MHLQKFSITPQGATGSATGSASVAFQRGAELHALYVNYTSVTNDTVVALWLVDPAVAVVTLTASSTDGWFYPRQQPTTTTSAAYTSTASPLLKIPLLGTVAARATASSSTANGVIVYAYVNDVL